MKRLSLALLALPAAALAAVQVTPGPWTLYRGTAIVQPRIDYATLTDCAAAADALSIARTYTCRSTANVVVTVVPPAPVDCVVSEWGPETSTAITNPDGSQTVTYTHSRTVLTQPANGGAACPPLSEVTRTETLPPPASGGVTGSYDPGPASVDLSDANAVARYPGYTAASAVDIGNVSGGTQYQDDPRTVNGSHKGLYKAGGSFSFAVAGNANTRTLKIYVGGWASTGRLTVTQNGQTAYTDAQGHGSDQWDAVYSITFAGPITVTWSQDAGSGNVTIQAAALYGASSPPPPPPPTGNALLHWSAPSTNTDGTPLTDLAGFYIYRGTDPAALSRVAKIDGASETSFTDQALAAGTWYYAASAFNARGAESAKTAVASKTIQ